VLDSAILLPVRVLGPIPSAERLLLINSMAIMLVAVVRLVVLLIQHARYPHLDESYEKGRVEFVVWSILALTVILLGGVIWIGSHQLDPRAPIPGKSDPLHVDVVALDWSGCSSTPIRVSLHISQNDR
jgi:cytochrome o ubiquinol oxidase subunit 2